MSFIVAHMACAGNDDLSRIEQCITDNNEAKVFADVVQKYCACMSNKMGSGFAMSVSDWENTHLKEREKCDIKAGWSTR